MNNTELLNKAIELFDSYDKWNAFIMLSNARGEIRNRYFEKLKSGLLKHYITDVNEEWRFLPFGNDQYRWFLKDFGQNSICLLWRTPDLVLWCDPQTSNAQKAKDLLNTPEFNFIFSGFDFTDSISMPNIHHFCEEKHRYSFSDNLYYSSIEEDNSDKLAWFAGNHTSEMVKQITDKISRFRTSKITELLKELNNQCKNP